jgi:hypothetical protein
MLSGEPMQLSQSVLSRAHTTVPPRSPDDRAILLAWLATQQIETSGLVPPPIVSDVLTTNAAESLTGEALLVAWQSYVEAARDEKDAENGWLTWVGLWDGVPADLPPGVTSIEMARRNVQAALHLLVHGSSAA